MLLEVGRLMVMMNHHIWAIVLTIVLGLTALLLGSKIRQPAVRQCLLAIGMLMLSLTMATGASIGPMDDWQHQHGTCLLATIDHMERDQK